MGPPRPSDPSLPRNSGRGNSPLDERVVIWYHALVRDLARSPPPELATPKGASVNRYTSPLLTSVAALLLLASLTHAETVRVGPPGDADYPTILEAMSGCADGDTILIYPGTYTGPENTNLDPGTRNLVIRSVSGPSETIISCSSGYRGFHIHGGQDTTMVLEGLRFGAGRMGYGAAILVENASGVKIVDCSFTNCDATYGGGGVRVESGVAVIENTSFKQCGNYYSSCKGGCVSVVGGECYVRGCTFENNEADYGGGVHAEDAWVGIHDCSFEENHSDYRGAGLRLLRCTATISGCLFKTNSAGTYGGAVLLEASAVEASGCVVSDNICGYNAAQVNIKSSSALDVHLSRWTFTGEGTWNTPRGHVQVTSSDPLLTQCVFAFGNEGPAVYADGSSTPEIANCVVYACAGGDSLPGYHHDNLFEEPLFCNIFNEDLEYCDNSPCLPDNNPWGLNIGAYGVVGCGECLTPVEPMTWETIKAMYR